MKTTSIALAILPLLTANVMARPFDSIQPTRSGGLSSTSRITTTDRLMKMDDRVVIVRQGRAIPMTAETTLTNGSRVSLDGTLISQSGSRQKLPDCTVLGPDGGRVPDHASRVVMIDGQMMVMRDGATRRMEMSTSLGSGRTVTQDGYLIEGSRKREIPEGAIFTIGSSAR
ncbi:hypothetical protein KBB96_06095 [Luteolibacter ambystomatis]|uniref:DUF6799 domain-containing protein n=1 Tax=Luteolibacter ambystomatis TaxID=2824561 RepID=A0A975J1U9_9BACT|nr:DUF6799 domain-containing protein [Luteolibacter ambystomatis]QUE52461.1 hypothetical protein KBB96_06095 [Luteolibacter ambystomatis]